MKTIALMLVLALLTTGCAAVEVQGVPLNPEEPMTDAERKAEDQMSILLMLAGGLFAVVMIGSIAGN